MVSPFDGTVIFAGPFRGYGNIIIIEHGEHYMSLLAGLNSIDCEVGQMLWPANRSDRMPEKRRRQALCRTAKRQPARSTPEAWFAK